MSGCWEGHQACWAAGEGAPAVAAAQGGPAQPAWEWPEGEALAPASSLRGSPVLCKGQLLPLALCGRVSAGKSRLYSWWLTPPPTPLACRFQEKGNLEVLLFSIQSKLRANNRKLYVPREGRSISDINKVAPRGPERGSGPWGPAAHRGPELRGPCPPATTTLPLSLARPGAGWRRPSTSGRWPCGTNSFARKSWSCWPSALTTRLPCGRPGWARTSG